MLADVEELVTGAREARRPSSTGFGDRPLSPVLPIGGLMRFP
jgi:hypothetical protein